jgi:hypothetical protein
MKNPTRLKKIKKREVWKQTKLTFLHAAPLGSFVGVAVYLLITLKIKTFTWRS